MSNKRNYYKNYKAVRRRNAASNYPPPEFSVDSDVDEENVPDLNTASNQQQQQHADIVHEEELVQEEEVNSDNDDNNSDFNGPDETVQEGNGEDDDLQLFANDYVDNAENFLEEAAANENIIWRRNVPDSSSESSEDIDQSKNIKIFYYFIFYWREIEEKGSQLQVLLRMFKFVIQFLNMGISC